MSKKATCFLIDDDVDDQEFFDMAIKDTYLKPACHFCNDCSQALGLLKIADFIPDYIFLDLNMPGMNGTECLAELKKMAHLEGIPIIIYSTSSDARLISEIKSLGATDFIIKPTELSNLTAILDQMLKCYERK